MASRLKSYLSKTLAELELRTADELIESRYEKFRRIGVFLEDPISAGLKASRPVDRKLRRFE